MANPPLPPGFQLDGAPQQPPLPPGFQLDAPQPSSPSAAGSGDGDFTPGYTDANGVAHPPHIVIRGATPIQPPTVGDRAQELNAAEAPQGPSVGGSLLATGNGLVNGIPVVGPMITKASDFALAQTLGRLEGKDPSQFMADAQATRDATNNANPVANVAGNVAGAVGSFAAGGAVPEGAAALGMTGRVVPRVINSAVSNAGISGADALARGESPQQAGEDALIGGAAGAAIPAASEAVRGIVAPIAARFQPAIGTLTNADQEAARRVGTAINADRQSGQDIIRSSDLPVANQNNIPIVNADRGGETTRALVRSVANQSPEARAIFDKVSSDRFAGQAPRAENFVRRLFGGSVDDLGYQQRLKTSAQAANGPAYRLAEQSANAQSMWTPDLEQLMQSNKFRAAVRSAESRGTDRAAIEGVPAVKNPFNFAADGTITLKPGMTPNLRFWDQVKRNLDGFIETAQRGAKPDNTVVSDLTQLKGKLTDTLDGLVPEYKTARAGAAAYFGAQDALEAGKKFAGTLNMLPEARAAFMKMNPAEKRAFGVGYASSLVDKIRVAGDRTNVINQIFKSPASRQAVELILGADKAKQVEAYVRVEDLADKLRGALGNSTTARQLVELGIGGVAGYEFGGHDLKGFLSGAALVKGGRYIAGKADARVMQGVAKLLMSNDPEAINKATKQAAQSPALMKAIDNLGALLSAPVRAATVAGTERAVAAQ